LKPANASDTGKCGSIGAVEHPNIDVSSAFQNILVNICTLIFSEEKELLSVYSGAALTTVFIISSYSSSTSLKRLNFSSKMTYRAC
jgi:hypothetical protein